MIGPLARRSLRGRSATIPLSGWTSFCSTTRRPAGYVLLGLVMLGFVVIDPVFASPPPGSEQSAGQGSMLRSLLFFVVVPSVVFAIVVGLVASGLSRIGDTLTQIKLRTRGGPAIAILGGVAMAGPLYADSVPVLSGGTPPLFGLGAGLIVFGIVLSIGSVRDRLTYWPLLVSTAVVTAVAAGVAVGWAMELDVLTRSSVAQLPYMLPLFALIPAGYALGQGNLRRSIVTATTGFAAAMVLLTLASGSSARGLGFLLTIISVMYAVAIAVLGSPALAVGAALSSETAEDSDTPVMSAN